MGEGKVQQHHPKTALEIFIGILTVLFSIYDFITYPVYFFILRPWRVMRLHRARRIEKVRSDAMSLTFRSNREKSPIHCQWEESEIDTIPKMIKYAVRRREHAKCLGTRQILAEEDEKQPNGRIFKKYAMGDYQWRTTNDVDTESEHFGRGLLELGLQPKDKVVIFAETRAEWILAALGCFKQNFIVATMYATLGEDALIHAINETESSCIVTSHDLLPKLPSVLEQTPAVKYIVYMEDQIKKTDTSIIKEGIQAHAYKKVVEMGEHSEKEGEECQADDLALIMYTSGSTGTPKGVLLPHRNILSTVYGMTDLPNYKPEGDRYLAYLPLAHILEFVSELFALSYGVRIGYSSALTMMDNSSKIKRGSKGDATILQPTIITSVPVIIDRVYKGIQDKMAKSGKLVETLFQFAVDYKLKWYRLGFNTPLLNKFLFSRLRPLLGGHVHLIMCGGAPLSSDIQEYVRACLCADITLGYGLTETCAAAMIQDTDDRSVGRVGSPMTEVQITLRSWEEGNYKVTDKPFPRGEIIIGGPGVSVGYYKLEEKSKEEFFVDKDGKRWMYSGDIGELQKDGILKIIDRKKDLVKLQFGEYVALGKVESELKTHPLVDNVCVYGDSTKTFTVGLIVPNKNQLRIFAEKIGRNGVTFETMCADPKLQQDVCKELQAHALKCKLAKFEIPGAITLCSEPWVPESGLMTAAMKIRRKNIQDYYQADIDRMYAA